MNNTITILPSMTVIDAAATAVARNGILQTNGRACVIASSLLPGYVKIHATAKKAA